MSHTFFYERTAEFDQPNNLLDSFEQQDVLRESVNAIRRELNSFKGGIEKQNNDDLESSAVIPNVRLFDSCEGTCKDEPHFVRGEELRKSADAVGVQLGSIAGMMDSSGALSSGSRAAIDGAEATKLSPEEQKYRKELGRYNQCIVANLFLGADLVCVPPPNPRFRGYEYGPYRYRDQRDNYHRNQPSYLRADLRGTGYSAS